MEKRILPNATAILILGILSILTCCCYGIGLVFGIVALVLASKDMKLYLQEPEAYSNYSNLNIGRVLSIIGVVLSALMLVMVIISFSFGEERTKEFLDNWKLKLEQSQNQD